MFHIAKNTFKEIVRNKFLYLILFFAFIFIVFSLALGKLTIGESEKVIVDFGLAMIEIFGLIGVLFVGSQLLFKEVEGKTIFLILSKPIKRQDFILGKYLGFSFTIMLIIFSQAILFLSVLMFQNIALSMLVLWAIFFTLLKLLILLSVVFFLSTFMTPISTIIVSMMIYIISHSFSLLIDLFTRSGQQIFSYIAYFFQLFFPPFEALNIKDMIGSFQDFTDYFFILNTSYSILYILLILFLTIQIFTRKTFEE